MSSQLSHRHTLKSTEVVALCMMHAGGDQPLASRPCRPAAWGGPLRSRSLCLCPKAPPALPRTCHHLLVFTSKDVSTEVYLLLTDKRGRPSGKPPMGAQPPGPNGTTQGPTASAQCAAPRAVGSSRLVSRWAPGLPRVKALLQAPSKGAPPGCSPPARGQGRAEKLPNLSKGNCDGSSEGCPPTPGVTRCGFWRNISTHGGLFCRHKHTLSKIGNVESLVQKEGMKPTLFTICWISRTCKPFFQKHSCERRFLRSGYLSCSQASWDDATIEGLTQGPTSVPMGGGDRADPGTAARDMLKWVDQRLPFCEPANPNRAGGTRSPLANHHWHRNHTTDSGVYCSRVFIKTNWVRKQQQDFFSHFFRLFCLATLLHISSK